VTPKVRVVMGGIVGAIAGFLTRPCCVIPVALSAAGFGSAGIARAAMVNRPAFMCASVLMLAGSMWMTFRREGWLACEGLCGGRDDSRVRVLWELLMFTRTICAMAIAGAAWVLPTPASAQMT
jgi:hypothetical protein